MDCHFRDLPDFQSSEARLTTASAVHKLTWDFFVAGWMLVCVGACAAEAVINRASELWKSGKSRKLQSISNFS